MYYVGSAVGAFILVYFFQTIFALFMAKDDEPIPRSSKTTILPTALICGLAGFGFADGGPYAFWIWPVYILAGGLPVWFLAKHRYEKAWISE